jgi:hypothetical protein
MSHNSNCSAKEKKRQKKKKNKQKKDKRKKNKKLIVLQQHKNKTKKITELPSEWKWENKATPLGMAHHPSSPCFFLKVHPSSSDVHKDSR